MNDINMSDGGGHLPGTRTAKRRKYAASITAAALLASAATAIAAGRADASATAGIVNVKWAGYAASGTRFASATGTWTVPSATCGQADPRTTFVWVGLDGATPGASTVEQAGSGISCAADGSARHFAWTEFYPNLSSILDTNAYPVQPGDVMTTTIGAGPGVFSVTMTDQRNGAGIWNYSTTIASPGATFTSAEWIVEAPSATAGGADLPILPVDTAFTNVSATTSDGVTSGLGGNAFDWQLITLNQGAWTETPSPVDAAGSSFSVTAAPYVAAPALTAAQAKAQAKALAKAAARAKAQAAAQAKAAARTAALAQSRAKAAARATTKSKGKGR